MPNTPISTPPMPSIPVPNTISASNSSIQPKESEPVCLNPGLDQCPKPSSDSRSGQENIKDIIVYSRRQKAQNETEDRTLSQHCQETISGSQQHTGIASQDTIFPENFNDMDLPIALRKGKRSCTLHPIGNFVSYKNLSSSYRAFTTSLNEIQIPRNIQEALNQPEWKMAVMEEIDALKRNKTWDYTELPAGKKLVGCK